MVAGRMISAGSRPRLVCDSTGLAAPPARDDDQVASLAWTPVLPEPSDDAPLRPAPPPAGEPTTVVFDFDCTLTSLHMCARARAARARADALSASRERAGETGGRAFSRVARARWRSVMWWCYDRYS